MSTMATISEIYPNNMISTMFTMLSSDVCDVLKLCLITNPHIAEAFNQTLVTSAILSFIEKAFDQIYWRKVFQSLCLVCRFYVRNKSNHVKRNLSPMAALGPKRAGFRPNPSWVTLEISKTFVWSPDPKNTKI